MFSNKRRASDLVGDNLGPKGRNVVLESKYSSPNDLAGDGTTTSDVLAQGLIVEGVKVCALLHLSSYHHYVGTIFTREVAAGANPVLVTRDIEKTPKALASELELKERFKTVNLQMLQLLVLGKTTSRKYDSQGHEQSWKKGCGYP
ncbi:hypothetical protein DITRI_Ditri17bG0004400 [Diplodiscus trichospermus]